ncbi:MAG: hypothetical protein O9267_06770 [Flavobacterium sp.]|uniref:hypothetical protein n=1 Tax=Flavobacterium sp. TaxID=239 RepID=UPI0022C13FEA|nr:hypothetical protein [Flavobacterium sp.]MCZ8197290.1 hypothetical protein [Flavobacterium sp.]
MKILVIAEDIRVNSTSAGICNSNFIDGLLQLNQKIDLVYDFSESDDLSWFQNQENLTSYSIHPIKKDTLTSKLVDVVPKMNSVFAKITGFGYSDLLKIKAWTKKIKYLVNNQDYKCVIFLGAGNSMLNYFSILKINFNVPILVNFHDPYPDNQYPFPYTKNNNVANKIKSKKTDKIITKATFVSFPSQRLYEWMSNFHSQLINKTIIIPHINAKLVGLPSLIEDDSVNLKPDSFNIVHGGSLLGHRNPEFLIKAFTKFIDEDIERKEKAFLNIFGRIVEENHLNKKYIDNCSNIVIVNKRISYKKSKEIFSKSDVLLVLETVSNDSPFLPGKFIDYLDANKNILALTSPNSEIARLLTPQYPYLSEIDNIEKIYNILVNLWNNWKESKLVNQVPSYLNEYVSIQQLQKFIKKIDTK